MDLKYVGPKPIISQHGISFDNNKDDKYVYLGIVLELLKALDHNYFEDKTYIYNTETNKFDDRTLYHELGKYCQNIDSLVDKESHNIEDEIEENLQHAEKNSFLEPEDREVLIKNITIMHDYMLQRSVNKAVYYCAITALANLVKKDHIHYIIVPMFQSFVHVLHSIQGVLREEKFPIDTDLEIYKKNGKLLVKLKIINY